MKQRLIVRLLFCLTILNGCGQSRTYLDSIEKGWNPYVVGQLLIFRSAEGDIDSIRIKEVIDNAFPDGIGARKNERLRVVATHKIEKDNRTTHLSFLYLVAKWLDNSSEIDFEFFLDGDGFWGRGYEIYDLDQFPVFSIETEFGTFNDVIRIDDNSNRPFKSNEIQTIYWSKSVGYLKYDRKDGRSGELINMILSSGR